LQLSDLEQIEPQELDRVLADAEGLLAECRAIPEGRVR